MGSVTICHSCSDLKKIFFSQHNFLTQSRNPDFYPLLLRSYLRNPEPLVIYLSDTCIILMQLSILHVLHSVLGAIFGYALDYHGTLEATNEA